MTVLSCAEARALVSDYIDGDLQRPVATDLERHLETCPWCPPLYASLVSSLAALKAQPDTGPAVDALVARVVAAVNTLGPPRSPETEKGTHP